MSGSARSLAALIALAAAFGGGYLTAYLPARKEASQLKAAADAAEADRKRASAELEQGKLRLQVADLRGKLGRVYIDLNENNYGKAAEKITPFFDGLRDLLESGLPLPAADREVLQAISARRDEIVTDLAKANPDARRKVGEMFAALYDLL